MISKNSARSIHINIRGTVYQFIYIYIYVSLSLIFHLTFQNKSSITLIHALHGNHRKPHLKACARAANAQGSWPPSKNHRFAPRFCGGGQWYGISIWHQLKQQLGGFLKWWYPTTMGFPTKNDHFGVFRGYHHLRKHPIWCVKKHSKKKRPQNASLQIIG